jgi:hypothetical protein
MSMTKAERAEMDALRLRLALAWPSFDRPEPMTRDEIAAAPKVEIARYGLPAQVTAGWFGFFSGFPSQGWSDGLVHNSASMSGASATKGFGRMYRSYDEAARALAWNVADDCAARMRRALEVVESGQ